MTYRSTDGSQIGTLTSPIGHTENTATARASRRRGGDGGARTSGVSSPESIRRRDLHVAVGCPTAYPLAVFP
jgi:hypothetical protein